MVNLNSLESDEKPATPEQKLWRAVFLQAIQDTFGICTVAMSRDEWRESKWWGRIYNQDFIELCEFELFGIHNKDVSDWIVKNLDYDQCILEFWTPNDPNSGWIHCSYNDAGNRKQYLNAQKLNGRIIYTIM